MGFFNNLRIGNQFRDHGLALLESSGFKLDEKPPMDTLVRYTPWLFADPARTTVRATGQIEGVNVEIFEYDATAMASEPGDHEYHLLALVWHPDISGNARIRPDPSQWKTGSRVRDALSSLAPFAALRSMSWSARVALGVSNEDLKVGHDEFDRLYIVNAISSEAATRVIPPALCQALPRIAFKGSIELRPGLMMISHDKAGMTPTRLGYLMEPLPALITAVLPKQPPPFR